MFRPQNPFLANEFRGLIHSDFSEAIKTSQNPISFKYFQNNCLPVLNSVRSSSFKQEPFPFPQKLVDPRFSSSNIPDLITRPQTATGIFNHYEKEKKENMEKIIREKQEREVTNAMKQLDEFNLRQGDKKGGRVGYPNIQYKELLDMAKVGNEWEVNKN